LRFAAGALPLEATSESGEAPAEGAMRIVGVRPEDLLAATEAATGTAPARVNSIVFHGRTLRLHAELGQGAPVVIDAPRQAEGFQFSVGDVAHISLRRGANCPMLPS
jgi:spermidine/putrescine transport system ATP-binding protein